MRETIIGIIKYRLTMGRTKEDIVTGLAFTICETLELTKDQFIDFVRNEKPHVDHIGKYNPPKTLNLFGTEFKKGEFEKVRSIREVPEIDHVDQEYKELAELVEA